MAVCVQQMEPESAANGRRRKVKIPQMTSSMSGYLDLVRFLAAAAVYIVHLGSKPFTESYLHWYLTQFGDLAVTIFFVLSGYVIAHVVATREREWTTYASSRFSRLYSVALVAAAITLVLDSAGQSLAPRFYEIQKVLWEPPSFVGYLASLAFVNEWQVFGFDGISIGTNGPWWSLSFEATYYLLAGLLLFAPALLSVPASIVVLLAAGSTVAALAPLWALGFFSYRLNARIHPPVTLAALLFVVGALAIAAYPYLVWHVPKIEMSFPFGPGPFQRHIAADYFAAGAFAVHLVGASRLSQCISTVSSPVHKALQWAGSLTFPLYLIHYPVLCFAAAISPFSRDGAANALFITIAVGVAVATATPLCDRLKFVLRAKLRPQPMR